MNLYFIRHGQSFVNLKEWEKGNVDVGLTDLGQRQAAALGKWLPAHIPEVDAIYASTMARARETAAAVAAPYSLTIQFDDHLREVGNNRFDHVPFPSDALPTQYADYWGSERPFSPIVIHEDVGETMMHFRTRVGIFIERVVAAHTLMAAHRQQTVLVVCHGGVVEGAFNHIFNIGPWGRCEVWDHNTAITYFEYVGHPGRETWRLHYHNRIDHLAGVE